MISDNDNENHVYIYDYIHNMLYYHIYSICIYTSMFFLHACKRMFYDQVLSVQCCLIWLIERWTVFLGGSRWRPNRKWIQGSKEKPNHRDRDFNLLRSKSLGNTEALEDHNWLVVFSKIFLEFSPRFFLGRWILNPIWLAHIFQMGWGKTTN